MEIMDYSTEKITKPETTIDRLWDRLVLAGIIKTENDKEGPVKEEGNNIYTLNTEDGYTVELIEDENGQVTIGDIAKGALPPVVRKIETSSTNNSIIAKATVSRLKNGTIEYWCKVSTQDDSEYQKMTNLGSGEAEITLTPVEGTTYKIKVFAKNEAGEHTEYAEITIGVKVKGISLNKTTAFVNPGKTITLTATVEPSNATNKGVTWSSNPTSIATVDETGKVIGVAKGTATITVTSDDDTTKKASCTVTVSNEANWEEISEWAEYIATHVSEVSGTGTSKTAKRFAGDTSPLKVGDTFKVYYGSNLIEVEIIDFLNDDLADGERYASDTSKTKAGITFDFKNSIGSGRMNETYTNSGGWGSSDMRTKTITGYLTIPVVRKNLSTNLKNVIKTVKKGTYKYEAPGALDYTNDDLWLLSEYEVFGEKTGSNGKEGEQYAYYTTSSKVKTRYWWLRSPGGDYSNVFCSVDNGTRNNFLANYDLGVVPGFCI